MTYQAPRIVPNDAYFDSAFAGTRLYAEDLEKLDTVMLGSVRNELKELRRELKRRRWEILNYLKHHGDYPEDVNAKSFKGLEFKIKKTTLLSIKASQLYENRLDKERQRVKQEKDDSLSSIYKAKLAKEKIFKYVITDFLFETFDQLEVSQLLSKAHHVAYILSELQEASDK